MAIMLDCGYNVISYGQHMTQLNGEGAQFTVNLLILNKAGTQRDYIWDASWFSVLQLPQEFQKEYSF